MKVILFRDLPTEGWPSMERYADELLAYLPRLNCEADAYVAPRPLPRLKGTAGTLFNYAWRSLAYPLAARRRQSELNHIVDHTYAHLINSLDAYRTVVTCHDIAPLALDQRGSGLSRRLWDRSFEAMLRAAHLLADSAHTRDEILRHSSYPPDRITVVPLGVNPIFFEAADVADWRAAQQLSQRRVVLHVGSCQARKNVDSILQALAQLNDRDVIFLQVGGTFTPAQQTLINALQLQERVQQIPHVAEVDLRAAYQAADAFVFPSFYEGFGLPVLEAMASGTPVICARATSLPEITGDAALLPDPSDVSQLAAAIRAVLDDARLADDLRARGRERARQFTWERTARETLAVYQQVLSC